MLFNSIEFFIFLPIVFIIYWLINNFGNKIQNVFLIIASYFFYGWWDIRFLTLIVFSSLVDYLVGIEMAKSVKVRKKRLFLFISIAVNLGLLGFFKYYNFFIESFVDAFSLLGHHANPYSLQIILPVGISFYTFQTLSYSIDVYKGKMVPTKDIAAFFAYVSFFPQLVAGPIERATNLLPQFFEKRAFNYSKSVDGMRQILWGFFKKVIIADNCALLVNNYFGNYSDQTGSTLILGSIFFAFQIYGDFSGYSDIAIGTARLFGFDLMRNFAFPYFSRDIAEFWRRWHISLSTWFRDYLYIPLGGSSGGTWMKIRNTFIIFVVSGFWHGANWTFMAWGFLNAVYFLPLLLLNANRNNIQFNPNKYLPSITELFKMVITFMLVCISWVFFRSPSIGDALKYLQLILINKFLPMPEIELSVLAFIGILILVEWVQRHKQHGLDLSNVNSRWIKWSFYYALVMLIIYFAPGEKQDFIYFQF